jgi:hypothetical protein
MDSTYAESILAWDGATWHEYQRGAPEFDRAAAVVRAGDAPGTGQPDAHGVLRSGTQTYSLSRGLDRRVGDRWQRVPLPAVDHTIRRGCADGHGGVWLAGKKYYHYTGGRWDTYPFAIAAGNDEPAFDFQVSDLKLVPGTRTILSHVRSSGEEEGVPDASDVEQYVTDA